MRHKEMVLTVIIGTAAFFLGKKATDTQSHRWTLYVRGSQNEDLTHFLKKVTFQLHDSFQNPKREMMQPPYELTEYGWGEFDIVVTLSFTDDAMEQPVDIMHKLKLYGEDPTGQANLKKPVVSETFEEIVFSEPSELFYNRLATYSAVPGPDVSVLPFLSAPDPTEDLQRLNAARSRVATSRANLLQQMQAAA